VDSELPSSSSASFPIPIRDQKFGVPGAFVILIEFSRRSGAISAAWVLDPAVLMCRTRRDCGSAIYRKFQLPIVHSIQVRQSNPAAGLARLVERIDWAVRLIVADDSSLNMFACEVCSASLSLSLSLSPSLFPPPPLSSPTTVHITSAAAMQTAPEMIEIAAHFLGPAALSVCPMPGLKTSSPFFAGAAFSIICLRERTND
jgi:hypothetical protein